MASVNHGHDPVLYTQLAVKKVCCVALMRLSTSVMHVSIKHDTAVSVPHYLKKKGGTVGGAHAIQHAGLIASVDSW